MTLPYDLSRIGKVVALLLLLYCVAEAAFVVFSFMLFDFYNQVDLDLLSARELDQEAARVDAMGLVIAVAFLIALLGSYIASGMFLYRAAANAQAVTPNNARITPGWSVGWYFVPFANIVMPYRAMRQTWNGLKGIDGLDAGLPGWAVVWWVCWLIGNAFATVSLRINADATTIEDFRMSSTFDVVSSILSIIAALLFRNLILTLTRASAGAVPHTPSAAPTPQGG